MVIIIYDEVQAPLTPSQKAAMDVAYSRVMLYRTGRNCGKSRLAKLFVKQIIKEGIECHSIKK